MTGKRVLRGLSPLEWALVGTVFVVCFVGAALVPLIHCPDEPGRVLLIDWMVHTKTLPTGNEAETFVGNWGFSYALRPFLPQMISAIFVKTASLVTASERALLLAARLTSVLCATACCCFVLGLGHHLFRRRESAALFAAVVCLLPQVVYLGMYVNNDVPALAAVSAMLYFMVRCYDDGWQVRDFIGLAVAASACLLTYYNAYCWILAAFVFCLVGVLSDKSVPDRKALVVRRLALVVGICALLAGWFFVRSALLHDGDPIGLSTEARDREMWAARGLELTPYIVPAEAGISFLEFFAWKNWEVLWMSTRSFVGTFGYMLIYLPLPRYGLYYALFLGGIAGYVAVVVRERPNKRDALLIAAMLLAAFITVFLHIWASYARDYQPQGRYVITLILLLGYVMSYGVDRLSLRVEGGDAAPVPLARLVGCAWVVLFALTYFGTMTQMLA